MGILNVTPDSFSDGGKFLESRAAVEHGLAMVEEGADILDIGAESARPGAASIDEEEELRRLYPVLEELGRHSQVPISVDTTKSSVARTALELGATIINDISALRFDTDMAGVVARAQAGLVLMHMQGTPQTMQQSCSYEHVVDEIQGFLQERFQWATEQGIAPDHIIVDPGIGFGKNIRHNLLLIANLRSFHSLGRPVMVGVSNKAFIGTILEKEIEDRLMGTAAAVATAVLQGAHIVRVHDVARMKEVVRMAQALRDIQLDERKEEI